MDIGLISDTHGFLDPRVIKLFGDCDEVWHAGDFGPQVAEKLQRAFPVFRGVAGNIDDDSVRLQYPEDLRFTCAGVDVWLTHIAGRPGRYDRRVRALLRQNPPDLLVCGHSHVLHVETDYELQNMQYLNPGAAGHHGFHHQRTLLKVKLEAGEISKIRLIELGARGRRIEARSNTV